MHKLIEKRHINYLTLKYKVINLERKYQQSRQPQIIIPYVYNLATLFIISIIIFILCVLESDAGSAIWICGSIFALIVPAIAYLLITHQQKFLYYHLFWNFFLQLSISAVKYIYFYTYKHESAEHQDRNPITKSNSTTYCNLNDSDLLLFILSHEAITFSQAFFIDSTHFIVDLIIIVLDRFINGIIFGSLIKQNAILSLLFYLVPIFLVFNRYFRELVERTRFLENNNNSEWVNIIDNMYNSSLIVSRWDSRHQTIELIRVSANAEAKYRIFDSQSMKNFYSRIQLDMKNCDIQMSNIMEDGKKLSLKDYLLWRCVHQEEQKCKKQMGKKKAQKVNNQLSQNLKQQDSLSKLYIQFQRNLKKLNFQQIILQLINDVLNTVYFKLSNDKLFKKSLEFLFLIVNLNKKVSLIETLHYFKTNKLIENEIPSAKRQRCKSMHQRNMVESETLIGYYYRSEEDQNYSRIFRIKVSNFQMNDVALVTSVEDITYQDDIKYFQNSKIQSDKLLLQTINDFRIKLIPIITGIGIFENANLEEQYDNVVETIKYNTYLIMNHIYIIFDYFSITEKKQVTIKMVLKQSYLKKIFQLIQNQYTQNNAQFSLKQMMWDIVGMFTAQAKMNSVSFIHRNDARRMDKTFSDERRIKQVLITVLSNALNMISSGSVTFKVGLDRNEMQLSQSFIDSPTNKNHPSLKFEIEVSTNEKKQKRDDVPEDFEQLFKKIENQVIDEVVKTLGPYQIKTEDLIESNTIRISFSIYADFVNLRKEERLHSLIRPELSINNSQQQPNSQRSRATSRNNALTQIRQAKKSTDSAPTGSSHLIQLGSPSNSAFYTNEKIPIQPDSPLKTFKLNSSDDNTKEASVMDNLKKQIDQQMEEFNEEKLRKMKEKGRNLSLSPIFQINNKGQKRSTTIRHGTNLLNSQQHQSFLNSLSNGQDVTIPQSQNILLNEESPSKNKQQRSFDQSFFSQCKQNNSEEQLSENKEKSIQDWGTPSGNLIDDENLKQSEFIEDKETNMKQLIESNFMLDSQCLQNKLSSYFSKNEGSDKLIQDNYQSRKSSTPQSPDNIIFMINQVDEETSKNDFLDLEHDSVNESSQNQVLENINLDFRVKKVSIFSPTKR